MEHSRSHTQVRKYALNTASKEYILIYLDIYVYECMYIYLFHSFRLHFVSQSEHGKHLLVAKCVLVGTYFCICLWTACVNAVRAWLTVNERYCYQKKKIILAWSCAKLNIYKIILYLCCDFFVCIFLYIHTYIQIYKTHQTFLYGYYVSTIYKSIYLHTSI